jgi:Fe-S-cluster containining protein
VIPDCQDCGACCFGPAHEHAFVSPRDAARFTPDERERLLELFPGHVVFLRMERRLAPASGLLHCAALEVEGGRYRCSVYERRPDVCRAFERGASGCRAVIEERGAAVRLAP